MGSTLFRTDDAFYLIPDDVTPAPGPVEVQALSGASMHVDPLQIARFRVTETVARAFAKRAATQAASQLEQSVMHAASDLEALRQDETLDAPAAALDELSAQLHELVSAFQAADLGTEAGRTAIESQLDELRRAKEPLDRS